MNPHHSDVAYAQRYDGGRGAAAAAAVRVGASQASTSQQRKRNWTRSSVPASSTVAPGKTYADYFSDRQGASSARHGPVRITISRGARYSIDPRTGLPVYEEIWDEEEVMDENEADGALYELNPQVGMHTYSGKREDNLYGGAAGSVTTAHKASSSKGQQDTARRISGAAPLDADELNMPVPTAKDLNASAEGAHQMLSNSSFIKVQQSTTHLYSRAAGPSIMVLDTNTLLAHFGFLRSLFPLLLVRNLKAFLLQALIPNASTKAPFTIPQHCRPAPFRLVLPHIVIRELDAIKTSDRAVSSDARQANRWILACLQAQKRSVNTFLTPSSVASVLQVAHSISGSLSIDANQAAEALVVQPIPPEAWALHFETSKQYNERIGQEAPTQGKRTNDERIVDLCVSLSTSTSMPVFLLSNDTNARSQAEIEGIRTLELESLMREPSKPSSPTKIRSLDDDKDGTSLDGVRYSRYAAPHSYSDPATAASELVEQWDAQVYGETWVPSPGPSTAAASSSESTVGQRVGAYADDDAMEVDM